MPRGTRKRYFKRKNTRNTVVWLLGGGLTGGGRVMV